MEQLETREITLNDAATMQKINEMTGVADITERDTVCEMPTLTPPPRQVLPRQTGPEYKQDSFLLRLPADDLEQTVRSKAIRLMKVAS